MKLARRALVVGVCTIALMLPGLAVPAVAQQTADAATLTASAETATFGDQIAFAGAVQSDPACLSARTVSLQSQQEGQTTWTDIAASTTGADGSFSFSFQPEFTGSYQALLPQTSGATPCAQIVSNPVSVAVAVDIEISPASDSVTSGTCPRMKASVQPPKPGQSVQFERRGRSGWTTLATESLDDSSKAGARLCFGWPDIGTVVLRVEWTAQDELNAPGSSAPLSIEIVRAPWMARVDTLAAGHAVSISVGEDGTFLYERGDTFPRAPASNEKLLLSMAILDKLGPTYSIETQAAAKSAQDGVIPGNLWILGQGDPSVTRADIAALAKAVEGAGVRRIVGSVIGDTGYFQHDWFAPGWKREFPQEEVAIPSALTFDWNTEGGVHISDPERLAAAALTQQLERRGVKVGGHPGAGHAPSDLQKVASIESPPLATLLRTENVDSVNFYAEVLGKLLGTQVSGPPGTIAKGAAAIERWTKDHGVPVTAYDASGLSYRDRVTARGLVKLLWAADEATWGQALMDSLPAPGQGTLENRLGGLKVRAKTGTLMNISALSGWVWLQREGTWADFSILSHGMAKSVEDAIVRTLSRSA